ncbi:MAG: hypothetical protein A2505_08620 [Deltaproteobacteria bacterium RIFOXYD12_FULL_55_16]|nr:MAG: hypothetical protein A2505_08620 [Deltaproteobacteria bacterium RIFOXYD12_FULL_55_16]
MIPSFAFIFNLVSTTARRGLRPILLALFFLTLLLAPTLTLAAVESAGTQVVTTSYLHHLGTFTGTLPFEWLPIIIDEAHQEAYVLNPAEHSVLVFNASGLLIYSFDTDRLGSVSDLAFLEDGDLLLLCSSSSGSGATLWRCDYRGEPQEEMAFTGLPPVMDGFRADRLILRKGLLYLADITDMRAAVFDLRGRFVEHFDLARLLELRKEGPLEANLGGFDVDQDGALLFTVPTSFHGYRLRPGQELEEFGRAGGAPGRFNVVGGIAAGPEGLIFVSDLLKSAVLVFDQDFNFLVEFGYRGLHPTSLIGPKNLAVSKSGRLYVSQLGKQGIKVFRFMVKQREGEIKN